MKIDHIKVSRFNVAELVKEINNRTEGRNVHSIFYEHTSLMSGVLEIKTTDIQHCIMKVEKPVKREAKKSKYRGVSWDKSLNKWRARIMVNGKRVSLGVYDDEEQAAYNYDYEAIKILGNKAKTNFLKVQCEKERAIFTKDKDGFTIGIKKEIK